AALLRILNRVPPAPSASRLGTAILMTLSPRLRFGYGGLRSRNLLAGALIPASATGLVLSLAIVPPFRRSRRAGMRTQGTIPSHPTRQPVPGRPRRAAQPWARGFEEGGSRGVAAPRSARSCEGGSGLRTPWRDGVRPKAEPARGFGKKKPSAGLAGEAVAFGAVGGKVVGRHHEAVAEAPD